MAKKNKQARVEVKETSSNEIQPAKGKLGVMIPGMGAVATTFVAGVEAVRKGFAKPIGSLTQMGTIRLGKRTDKRSPKIKEFMPLAGLDDRPLAPIMSRVGRLLFERGEEIYNFQGVRRYKDKYDPSPGSQVPPDQLNLSFAVTPTGVAVHGTF